MGPCTNPNCKSYGDPHPNCKCAISGQYAEGGEVSEDNSLLNQAMDYVRGKWDEGGENIHNTLQAAHEGNYEPLQNMATQNAMSTVGSVEVPQGLVGYAKAAPGAIERIATKLGLTGQAPEVVVKAANQAYSAGKLSANELQQVSNASKGVQPIKGYAEGGETSPQVQVKQVNIPSNTSIPLYDISGPQPVLGDMHPDDVHAAVASGKFSFPKGSSVPAFNSEGVLGDLPAEDAPSAFQSGYKYATPDAIEQHHYGQPSQQVLAGLEGVASGVVSKPIAHGLEIASGLTTGKDIEAREKVNPWTSGISEGVGLVGGALTGTGEAAILEKVGAEAAAKIFGAKTASAMAKIGARTVSDATQMALYQGGNEVSKLIEGDPNQSIGTAMADVGLSAVLGGTAGAALGSISPLWEATVGPKAEQLLGDFKSRMTFLRDNPNLEEALTKELGEHGSAIRKAEQAVSNGVSIPDKPNSWMLNDILEKKQGSISEKLSGKLEDAKEAFDKHSEVLQKKFGSDIEGLPIDPAKIESYIEQSGKASGATSRKALENYIDSAEKYHSLLKDAHAELGIESPILPSSQVTKSTLEQTTPGGRLADFVVKQGVDKISGRAAASGAGAALGHATGIPFAGTIGAVLGEKVLGPHFESIIHSIARPILEGALSSSGARAVADYAVAVAKGETMLNKAAKNLFKPGADVLSDHSLPSESSRQKLDSQLQKIQQDPAKLTSVGGQVGRYLPQHQAAMATMAVTASNYLNTLRPKPLSTLPLDPKLPPDPVKQSRYNRALDIANQPLIVVKSIHQGTLTPQDVQTLHAVNPGAYQRLSSKLTQEMMNHVSKGETVPYTTRLNLALFLGKPLDSTMTPAAIMSAQPQPPQPQPQTPTTPPSRPKTSTSSLGKTAKNVQTSGQAREARANKD